MAHCGPGVVGQVDIWVIIQLPTGAHQFKPVLVEPPGAKAVQVLKQQQLKLMALHGPGVLTHKEDWELVLLLQCPEAHLVSQLAVAQHGAN